MSLQHKPRGLRLGTVDGCEYTRSKSYSPNGQARWVVEYLKGLTGGRYLDIGCSDPFEGNNTWLLERLYGWTGFSVDRDAEVEAKWAVSGRAPQFIRGDVTKVPLNALPPQSFDYLSLDIDEDQLAFVERFPWEQVRFQCMTVEHDSYRFGTERRDRMRARLMSAGYHIVVKDVMSPKGPFEDWWASDL